MQTIEPVGFGTISESLFKEVASSGSSQCGTDSIANGTYDLVFEVDGLTSITLSYSCDATRIGFRSADQILLNLQHWGEGSESPDWDCDTYSFELTPVSNPYRFSFAGGTDIQVDDSVVGPDLSADFTAIVGDTDAASVSSVVSSP